MNRRDFVKLAGLAGTATVLEGCAGDKTDKVIAPYFIPRTSLVPGVSVDFATVCRECPAGCGMIARVRDGRCHKVEGNPDHPVNSGALCLRGQTSLQGLYNPDRFQGPMARGDHGQLQPISWDDAEKRLSQILFTARGGALWFGRLETGSLDRLINQWLAAVSPTHTRLSYETYSYEPLREAMGRVFGRPEIPQIRIAGARTLLSFGADFLETWVSNVEYARDFSAWRQARTRGDHGGRFVFIGPRVSLTAANADEWIAVRPGTEGLVARAIEAAMGGGGGGDVGALADAAGVPVDTITRLAREFKTGSSLALPVGQGGTTEDAVTANEAVLRMNQAAGNVGRTLILGSPHALSATSTHKEILAAVDGMRTGRYKVAFIHGANPAFTLPPSTGFADALSKVPEIVSLSSYPDETTAMATLVLPGHTPLESWGEYSPRPGITGIMQPAVPPVFDTRHAGDVLLRSATRAGHSLGADNFQAYLRKAHSMDDAAWDSMIQRGGIFTVTGTPGIGGGPKTSAAPGAGGTQPAGTMSVAGDAALGSAPNIKNGLKAGKISAAAAA